MRMIVADCVGFFGEEKEIKYCWVNIGFVHHGKSQKLFNDRRKIISNLMYSTSFSRNQKQQCRNRVC